MRVLQGSEGDQEGRGLPVLQAINALDAAWGKCDLMTVQSESAVFSQHLEHVLDPGLFVEIYKLALQRLAVKADTLLPCLQLSKKLLRTL